MNRDQALETIRQQEPTFLEAARRSGYVCPVCGNGKGKDGDGIAKDPSNPGGSHYKCFKCGLYGDVFELYGKVSNLSDFREQLEGAAAHYGIILEYQNQDKSERYTHTSTHTTAYTQTQPQDQEADQTSFYREAREHLKETDYLERRGISQEVGERFHLGYVESWRHPKAPNAPASPRLIIPTSKTSYLARDTRQNLTEDQKKYRISKVGSVRIFNSKALQAASKPIFIVEGELDALSVIEAGGEAVATGSASNRRALLKLLEAQKPSQPLIIAMDNDEAGEKAAQEISEGLQSLQIPFYRLNPYGDHKDANEALMADREAFKLAVEGAEQIEREAKEAEREAYLKKSTAHHLQGFINGIAESVNTPYISTGFNKLDGVLDGGLYEGLYIVGAISALGKTTLITQIADQIAQAGQDVLIISLEMARTELMAKSISRHTAIEVLKKGGDMRNAKTTRGITTGKRYQAYSQQEKDLIKTAITSYSAYAENIYILEGIGDIGALQVREAVRDHVAFTGRTPVIVIDYLQILAPHNERATDKQNTDKAVMELKRISRDYKTPVIGISSFNRENYKEAVSMRAFKESGAVEYSSDVLIGLQFEGAGKKDFNEEEASTREPRAIELVILKNRNGKARSRIPFNYYPMFNYFQEV